MGSFSLFPSLTLPWLLLSLNMREKLFGGDSVGFGCIRGKRVVYGVFAGKGWAIWGEYGRYGENLGGIGLNGVITDRRAVPFSPGGESGSMSELLEVTRYGLRLYAVRALSHRKRVPSILLASNGMLVLGFLFSLSSLGLHPRFPSSLGYCKTEPNCFGCLTIPQIRTWRRTGNPFYWIRR